VNKPVNDLLSTIASHWPGNDWKVQRSNIEPKTESTLLKLCCDKSQHLLNWRALLSFEETVSLTAEWYRAYYENGTQGMAELTQRQLTYYTTKAKNGKMAWTQ
jgi:CDP-glucose 4,6-dehydratase